MVESDNHKINMTTTMIDTVNHKITYITCSTINNFLTSYITFAVFIYTAKHTEASGTRGMRWAGL